MHFDSSKPSAPRARIGSAARFRGVGSGADAGPSPADYDAARGLAAHIPGGVMGTGGRSRANVDLMPGPADYAGAALYNPRRGSDAGVRFGTASRFGAGWGDGASPGPAAYAAEVAALRVKGAKSPAYRIGTAPRDQGPGGANLNPGGGTGTLFNPSLQCE